jgi:U4/U6.U5 tri-snRNP component SNU23
VYIFVAFPICPFSSPLTYSFPKFSVPASERVALTARDEFFDYESRIGKVTAVNEKDRSSGGFYCALCDVLLRDSLSYTNHINGRKHLRKAGISEYTKRSTLGEVLAVLEFGRRKKYPERYVAHNLTASLSAPKSRSKVIIKHDDVDESEMAIPPPAKKPKLEEDIPKPNSKPTTAKKSLADQDDDDDEDNEMTSMLGFSSFGAKPKGKAKNG